MKSSGSAVRSDASSAKFNITIWESGRARRQARDTAAREEPLEIRVDTQALTVAMRTPGHDEELACGFLLAEGVIHSLADIRAVRFHPRNDQGNVIDVHLREGLSVNPREWLRHVIASSSCGLCGRASVDVVRRKFGRVPPGPVVDGTVLPELPDRLRSAQQTFALTGGLHAAGLFSLAGELIVAREDVGRHNALDKALGHALRAGLLPLRNHIVLLSGRVSFEMMQKSLAAGAPIVAAVSAPSTLAIEFARSSRQTLIGFLRDGRFNIYSGRNRIRSRGGL